MNLNSFSGGQFKPAGDGQFEPASNGQIKPAKGGQFDRIFHPQLP